MTPATSAAAGGALAAPPPDRQAPPHLPARGQLSHSQRLHAKTALLRPRVEAATRRLWAAPDPAAHYRGYLCAMHAVVRATVPLLEAALARAQALAPHDPVAAGLVPWLRRHASAERGHDEWLRHDLAAAGGDPDEPLRRLVPAAVAELVGAQYYWVLHDHPVALLGHAAVLEGSPPPRQLGAWLAGRTGLPRAAFRTIERHAVLDRRHGAEVARVLDGLPLRPRDSALVGLSALHTLGALLRLLDSLAGPVRQEGAA